MSTYSAFYSEFAVRQLAAGHSGFQTNTAPFARLPAAWLQGPSSGVVKYALALLFSKDVLWLFK